MKAIVIDEFGGPEVFREADLPVPAPERGEVLVRIAAASVNPIDYKLRAAGQGMAPAFPAILGCDLAGIVEALGPDTGGFEIGDAVYGCAGGVKGLPGTYAEFISADARLLAKKPPNLTFQEAAALPLVTITAWEGLDRANVKAGDTILIVGGTGGVGHIAVQLAKARGAKVAATASSPEKADFVRSLGAEAIVDYNAEKLEAAAARLTGGTGFDVVFDTTGKDNFDAVFAAVKPAGHVVTIVAAYRADLLPMHLKALSLHAVFMLIPMLSGAGRAGHGRILRDAAAMAGRNALRVRVDRVFPLSGVADAHRLLERGGVIGKVAINVSTAL